MIKEVGTVSSFFIDFIYQQRSNDRYTTISQRNRYFLKTKAISVIIQYCILLFVISFTFIQNNSRKLLCFKFVINFLGNYGSDILNTYHFLSIFLFLYIIKLIYLMEVLQFCERIIRNNLSHILDTKSCHNFIT